MAPHLTELVYSAGGGASLLGISAYSDYPADTANKKIIGDAFHLNLELITALKPDVIFYWQNGTPKQTVEQLKSMNFNLMSIEIKQLTDIPATIHSIAKKLGTSPVQATDEFNIQLKKLQNQQHKAQSALIQISDQPIYTVNGSHWMSEAIAVCGLHNVFADLTTASAAVTLESVVISKPDVIVRMAAFDEHNQLNSWPSIPAIKNQHIIQLNPDHFSRPTLRTIDAINSLCNQLKQF